MQFLKCQTLNINPKNMWYVFFVMYHCKKLLLQLPFELRMHDRSVDKEPIYTIKYI